MDKSQRPIYLPVFRYRYPVTAIVSVLHRISGIVLFLLIPLLLWGLQKSLSSPADFAAIQSFFQSPLVMIIICLMALALIYHLFAGIRHLLMDFGLGDSLKVGRITAWWVLVLTGIATVLLFILLKGI